MINPPMLELKEITKESRIPDYLLSLHYDSYTVFRMSSP